MAFFSDRSVAALASSTLALAGVAAACSGDHGLLAVTSSAAPSSSSAGGAAVTTSSPASSATVTAGNGGAGGTDAGPPLPSKLTIVDGIADEDAVRFCFLPYPAGDPSAQPYPPNNASIAFAEPLVVDPIAAAIPAGTDVQVIAIGGDLSATAGLGCDAILALYQGELDAGAADAGDDANADDAGDAGPPPVPVPATIVTTLGVVPASAFTSGKSLLLVADGCLAPGHDDSTATVACGASYTPASPSATLVAAGMSRVTDASTIAAQVILASQSAASSDIRVVPGATAASEVSVASNLPPASLSAPFTTLSASDYGILPMAQLRTYAPNQATPSAAILFPEIFSHSIVTASDFTDGKAFTFIGVGGSPGVPAASWWHAFTFVLVAADPG